MSGAHPALPQPHARPQANDQQTMTTENTQNNTSLGGLASLRRWLLAAIGVFFVGLAALGVVVPGLPTTIFLILATWCFTRSCPWLERKLVQAPLFRPFQQYLRPGTRMPMRARLIALAMMWAAISVSLAKLARGGSLTTLILAALVAAGLAGTVSIWRMARGDSDVADTGHRATMESRTTAVND